MPLKFLFIIAVSLGAEPKASCQLCQGSLGDPVVNITFGTGNNPGPALGSGITNYTYVSNTCPNDGLYSVSSSIANCFNNSWHNVTEDHTPNDVNGYMMVVNASNNPGDFYVKTVDGLCGQTTYEFAAWILNIEKSSACFNNPILPNVTFNIETTNGTVLLSSKSGDIPSTTSPQWKQYGAYFTTPANITSVVLRMTNNAPGGCGNDLLLDDITFRPCGAKVSIATIGSVTQKDICSTDNSTIILNGNYLGTGNVAYQWQISKDNGNTWNDIAAANNLNFTWVKEAPGSYQYRLAVAQVVNLSIASCRTVSNVFIINVNAIPVPAATNNGPICEGQSLILKASDGLSYSWTGPNNYSSNAQSPVINNSSAAMAGKYGVVVTSNKGCLAADSTFTIIKPKPVAKFNAITSACAGQQVQFTDASNSSTGQISEWNWSFKDGQNSALQNPIHSFIDGTYNVSLVVKILNGCTDSVSNNIIINSLPVINFSTPAICEGTQGQFMDSSTIKDGTQNLFSYSWNFGDGTVSNIKSPFKSYAKGGNYTANLSVTSNNGCISTASKTFTVSSKPVADFIITNSNLCSSSPIKMTDNSSILYGKIKSAIVYWTWPNTTDTTFDNSPSTGKQYQKNYKSFGNPATENYTINYLVDNGEGCSSSISKAITLKASPQLVFDSVPVFCINSNQSFITQAKETSGLQGSGSFSGTGITQNGLFAPSIAGAGNHSIQYDYTAINGCSSAISKLIEVEALPKISAGPDKFYIENSSVILEASASSANLSFKWTPAIGLNNDAVLNPVATPKTETVYTLKATSVNGCSATDDVIVSILKLPIIPNVFSPNGDGTNDQWNVTYLSSYPGCTVDIYDRAGQLIFHSTGYKNLWDGTFKGKQLAVGVYYYIIDPKNGLKPVSGSITLLR